MLKLNLESYKTWVTIFIIIFLLILIPLIFIQHKNSKDNSKNNKLSEELHIEQIYFKNIQELDTLPIDQSLLFQDELSFYFKDKGQSVEEVEIEKGSLKDLGNNKCEFIVKYKNKKLKISIDKDKVTIQE